MKKKLLCGMLICLYFTAQAMEESKRKHHHSSSKIGHKHIVFDLEGVLLQPNISHVMHEIGTQGALAIAGNLGGSGLFKMAFSRRLPSTKDILEKFFEILEPIDYLEAEEHDSALYTAANLKYKGLPAPRIIKQWLLSGDTTTCKAIEQHVLAHIAQQELHHMQRNLAEKLTAITFDPEKNSESLQVVPEAVSLLKELKHHKNHLHIVTHWNHEAFGLLQAKYPKLFKHIDKHAITSGSTRQIKPELHETFLAKQETTWEKSFFIESDEEDLTALQHKHTDARGIVCTEGNYEAIRTQLQKFKALPKPKIGSQE